MQAGRFPANLAHGNVVVTDKGAAMKHATRLIAARIRLQITRRYWLNSTVDNHIHNHPNRDSIRHEAIACPCGPTDILLNDEDGDDCWGVQHHSLDGRENA